MNRWDLAPRLGIGVERVNRKCRSSNLIASLQKETSRKCSIIAVSYGNEVHVLLK